MIFSTSNVESETYWKIIRWLLPVVASVCVERADAFERHLEFDWLPSETGIVKNITYNLNLSTFKVRMCGSRSDYDSKIFLSYHLFTKWYLTLQNGHMNLSSSAECSLSNCVLVVVWNIVFLIIEKIFAMCSAFIMFAIYYCPLRLFMYQQLNR